ncbi:telomerase protein component 1 [Nephila pilipes]|uniref:Telomerase protein component 1 n=1 Tax=Nephila pilipes TaxID=299642 RepID=A0A8X6N736_NEPPI|nr:telomerase protein component 1 [Nephila pilipes]
MNSTECFKKHYESCRMEIVKTNRLVMMAEMATENIFLKETPLTCTKNKFLESEFYEKWCPSLTGMKRKLDSTVKENALLSTKNKFLKTTSDSNENSLSEKLLRSNKKKKKRHAKRPHISVHYRRAPMSDFVESYDAADSAGSRSRSRSRGSVSEDESVFDLESENLGSGLRGGFLEDDRHVSLFSSNSQNYLEKFSLGSTAAQIAPSAVFGSPAGPPIAQTAVFGSCAAAPKTALFGSSPAPPPGAGFYRSSIRALAKKSLRTLNQFNNVEAKDISEMPVYSFDSTEEYKRETYESFSFVNIEANNLQIDRVRRIKSTKMQFLNIASMALIYNANLKNDGDEYRKSLLKYADDVMGFDPEFILKVALFSRQELNIRSASNFLLSYAAYCQNTRPYLIKYFKSCIRLPSDWIEVADFYLTFKDSRLKDKSLPSVLKKAMAKSFSKFDEYQLAKYNRVKKAPGYTLKQLIRLIHLKSPANEIMCLLGKKYPETAEVFRKSGLPGIWDHKKAGQRMKLPIPETWETQISAHGNKACIWEKLLDNGKLPYMAMLRNLRNLIVSGISQKHHDKVLKQLENKIAVKNSRQSPLQFYEAFKVLTGIENIHNGNYRHWRSRDGLWKMEVLEKLVEKIQAVSLSLVKSYKRAVSAALEISTLHNLEPIPGKSLVICDIVLPSALDDKKIEKMFNLCIMMGLMCLKACEDCKMNVIYGSTTKNVLLKEDCSFLDSLESICLEYESFSVTKDGLTSSVDALKRTLEYYLKQNVILREKGKQRNFVRRRVRFQIFLKRLVLKCSNYFTENSDVQTLRMLI